MVGHHDQNLVRMPTACHLCQKWCGCGGYNPKCKFYGATTVKRLRSKRSSPTALKITARFTVGQLFQGLLCFPYLGRSQGKPPSHGSPFWFSWFLHSPPPFCRLSLIFLACSITEREKSRCIPWLYGHWMRIKIPQLFIIHLHPYWT